MRNKTLTTLHLRKPDFGEVHSTASEQSDLAPAGKRPLRILVTGARAPVALEIARRCSAAGHMVVVADSLRFGLTMFSRAASQRVLLPRPASSPQAFIAAVRQLVESQQIELIIPTCEEIFFLSRYRNELPCSLLADEFAKLSSIHNKFTFSQIAGNEFAQAPETIFVRSTEELEHFRSDTSLWVFKPVYSRFASQTRVAPTVSELAQIQPTDSMPWVAQQRIHGQEFSTYSVVRQGRLLAHACYRSEYRAGKGAGICFQPVTHPGIQCFVSSFVGHHHFSGQIGFDLIETRDGNLFVIEGNPRATSGVHLFDRSDTLAEILTGSQNPLLVPNQQTQLMIEFAMPLWGLVDAVRRRCVVRFLQDLIRARWISFSWRDPVPVLALPLSLLELAWIANREHLSVIQASTFDIEWNGEPL